MASGKSPDQRKRGRRKPLFESFALISYVMVAAVILAAVTFLVFHADLVTTLLVHMAFVSTVTFIAFGVDKRRAAKNHRRASEVNLLTLAAFGGAAGGLVGMGIFRHKTQQTIFCILLPTLLFTQVVLLLLILLS